VNILISLKDPRDQQGSALALTSSVFGFVQILGPVMAAPVFSYAISAGIDGLPFMIYGGVRIPG
jgi:hypothetical protein